VDADHLYPSGDQGDEVGQQRLLPSLVGHWQPARIAALLIGYSALFLAFERAFVSALV
jgi:hypothetical protein